MLYQSYNLFSWSKVAAKRATALFVAVFMLQIIAAGFCATMVGAAPAQQVIAGAHCATSAQHLSGLNMANMDMSSKTTNYACPHCDLPDINVSFDKTTFTTADLSADYFLLAMMPIADVVVITFDASPPHLSQLRTSLHSYNLNLRIRV